mmetsp:Transcript_12377/g.53132  ORF Transcript_12377/g.53132 Transcript_12377/m.53132 type:complete len:204 (+) Transcript_12377:724-1335(+)
MFGPVTTSARGFSSSFGAERGESERSRTGKLLVPDGKLSKRFPKALALPSLTELGTTESPPISVASRIGWRPSRMSRNASSEDSPRSSVSSASRNVGQQYPSCLASAANEHSASSPAAARTAPRSSKNLPAHSTLRKRRHAASHAPACRSRARSSAAARSSTAGGWYRTTFLLLFVLTRTQSCGTPSRDSGSSMRCSTSATVT